MLGKLIKYEWKRTGKVGGLMAILCAIVTLLGWLSFKSPMWRSVFDDSYYRFHPMDILSVMTLFMWILLLIGLSYGMIIYLGVHFYRTMYTDQGYLTHTLPVKKNQLLISKILVGGLWELIITVLVILSVMVVVGSLVKEALPDYYTMSDFLGDLGWFLREIFRELEDDRNIRAIGWIIYGIVTMLAGPFVTITILYGAITVGQLFTKVRVLMAIVCYVGVSIVNQMLSSLVQGITTALADRLDTYMNVTLNGSFLISLILAVTLYFVSRWIITNKLNME